MARKKEEESQAFLYIFYFNYSYYLCQIHKFASLCLGFFLFFFFNSLHGTTFR
jgi:hypothetical protein